MPQASLEIMRTRIKDRAEEPRIGHDTGALPEPAHHHARPLEIADPIAVNIQHDLGTLSECPTELGGGAARLGERYRRVTIDAPEAVPIGEPPQAGQRLIPPRRPAANEQNVDRTVGKQVPLLPVVLLIAEWVAFHQLDL